MLPRIATGAEPISFLTQAGLFFVVPLFLSVALGLSAIETGVRLGGLQNTGGASIGTALAGAVVISALTASFFTGIKDNPDVPSSVASHAQVELTSGVPFISDADLKAGLSDAGVPTKGTVALSPPAAPPALDRRRMGDSCGPKRADSFGSHICPCS